MQFSNVYTMIHRPSATEHDVRVESKSGESPDGMPSAMANIMCGHLSVGSREMIGADHLSANLRAIAGAMEFARTLAGPGSATFIHAMRQAAYEALNRVCPTSTAETLEPVILQCRDETFVRIVSRPVERLEAWDWLFGGAVRRMNAYSVEHRHNEDGRILAFFRGWDTPFVSRNPRDAAYSLMLHMRLRCINQELFVHKDLSEWVDGPHFSFCLGQLA